METWKYDPRLQFYHSHGKIYSNHHTVVIKVPTKQNLIDLVNMKINHPEAMISIQFGITYLHKKDQYCYKTGREESLRFCSNKMFNLDFVCFTKDTTIFGLTNGEYYIELETKEHRKKPHFTKFHFHKG